MIEYLEDAIELDPAEEFPQSVQEAGTYGHRTGDAVVDGWQEAAALGKEIDFGGAFVDPESKKAFEAAKAASKARHEARRGFTETEDIRNDYTKER